jgi:hypothetical protein
MTFIKSVYKNTPFFYFYRYEQGFYYGMIEVVELMPGNFWTLDEKK